MSLSQSQRWAVVLCGLGLSGMLLAFAFGNPPSYRYALVMAGSATLLIAGGLGWSIVDWSALTHRLDGRLLLLIVCSLVVRAAVAAPVIVSDTPPVRDERAYVGRAGVFSSLANTYLQGETPDQRTHALFYNNGQHGPLLPIVLSVFGTLIAPTVGVYRLVVVVTSALTTGVVYLFTRHLTTDRAALLAALAHIFYPTFLAYAHLLWSESLYLLLFGLCLLLLVKLDQAEQHRVGWTAVLGVCIGLAALTRAAMLPFLLLFPLWVAWRQSTWRDRLLLPTVMIVLWGIVIMPWQITLYANEGEIVPLATTSTVNLFNGNNPWIVPGTTSTDSYEYERYVFEQVRDIAQQRDVPVAAVTRDIALTEITSHPIDFVQRSLLRFAQLWTFDSFIITHFAQGAYPLIPNGLLAGLWLTLMGCIVAFVAAGAGGFTLRQPALRYRWLLLVVIGVTVAVPTLTQAFSRLNVPNLFLLLPAVGHFIAHRDASQRASRAAAAAAGGIVLLTMALTLRSTVHLAYAAPPYAPLFAPLSERLNIPPRTGATIRLTNTSDQPVTLELATASDEVSIQGKQPVTLAPGETTHRQIFTFSTPPDVTLTMRTEAAEVRINPFTNEARSGLIALDSLGVAYEWAVYLKPIYEGFSEPRPLSDYEY